MSLRSPTDIPIPGIPNIVYDPEQREYYNIRTDIFLSDDDISVLKLRRYSDISSPLPNPVPDDYFFQK